MAGDCSILYVTYRRRGAATNALSPCRATGTSTRRALFTLVARCSCYGADTVAALAPPAITAQDAIVRHARLGAATAVAILPRPAAFTVTLPTVAHSVT